MKRPPSADPSVNAYMDHLDKQIREFTTVGPSVAEACLRYIFLLSDPRFDIRIIGLGKRHGEALNVEVQKMMLDAKKKNK